MRKKFYLSALRVLMLGVLAMSIVSCVEDTETNETNDELVEVGVIECVDSNHVHAVDLGLSVKWACCNVGAHSPEGYGNYYCWGNLREMGVDYNWVEAGNSEDYIHPNSDISATGYDVAYMKWGNGWRMPTRAEFQELVDSCSWKRVMINNVEGQLVTGPNGNSIFLPAAGYRGYLGDSFRGECGYYWSGTLGIGDAADPAWSMYFIQDQKKFPFITDSIVCSITNGFYAESVRPVRN